MGRRPCIIAEITEVASVVAVETRDAQELRKAQSILLPALLGLDLVATGRVIGRSRASVARLQNEFKAEIKGKKPLRKSWGGRRKEYMTPAQEASFLEPFLVQAKAGGMLIVSAVQRAYEKETGHPVAPSTIYRLLARHGWRKIMPARHHPKNDPAAQEEWKKNSSTI
jgi:transposase